jgi:hypothetical protein
LGFAAVELESDREAEMAVSEHGNASLDLISQQQPVITPLSTQALRRWDARSVSQQSTVSSQGGDSIARNSHKKYR